MRIKMASRELTEALNSSLPDLRNPESEEK